MKAKQPNISINKIKSHTSGDSRLFEFTNHKKRSNSYRQDISVSSMISPAKEKKHKSQVYKRGSEANWNPIVKKRAK